VIAIAVMLLLVAIAAWATCLYLSLGGELPALLMTMAGAQDAKFWIGVILYFAVTGITEWKERT
jgi:hypothetical protein